MGDVGPAAVYATFLWWFSTGAILLLIGLPRRTHAWSFGAATLVCAASLAALAATADDTSPGGAYVAFTATLLVWGWQEVGFLTGLVTGPRRAPLRPGSSVLSRTGQAFQAILYHEAALIVSGFAVMAATAGGANQVGLWTFLVLWIMRASAKLNLFLGVPNRGEEFLPAHLRFIASYFARRSMNPLFPVSVTLSTLALGVMGTMIAGSAPGSFEAVGLSLVAALLALAIIEHWFFVLPIPSVALWRWSLRGRTHAPPPAAAPVPAAAPTLADLALDDRRIP